MDYFKTAQLMCARNDLKEVLRGNITYHGVGLCAGCGVPRPIIEAAIHDWPYGDTIDNCYPIKSPINGLSSKEAYNIAQQMKMMYVGEYGRRRLELAQRCIDVINQELAKWNTR